jgi:hypothetical protein
MKMRAMAAGVDTMARSAWLRLEGSKTGAMGRNCLPRAVHNPVRTSSMEGWKLVHLDSPKARRRGSPNLSSAILKDSASYVDAACSDEG